MTHRIGFALALAAGLAACTVARAQGLPTAEDPRLVPVASSPRVWNGVATTRDGRVFVAYTQSEGPGVQVAELVDGQPRPYPDASWNTPPANGPVAAAFVHVNGLRIGPDGALWVVDAGADGIGKPAQQGAARLVRIDTRSNQVTRLYPLGAAAEPLSYVDDVRFNGAFAYLTDAGVPGLMVLDLRTGAVRRVLDHHPAMTDARPVRADGKVLVQPDGKQVRVHADQLELSPDGKMLTVMPASGPAARIGTAWLDNPAIPPLDLASHVEPWLDTPSTGGTAIDAAGTIYLGDADRRRILRITSDGQVSTLVADPRLVWTDALWIDGDGFLWIPAAQLNRTAGLNGGVSAVQYPVWLYKMQIGAKPAPNDHP